MKTQFWNNEVWVSWGWRGHEDHEYWLKLGLFVHRRELLFKWIRNAK